jgi:toxin ParE1/3/4
LTGTLIWRPAARRDVTAIIRYIADRHAAAAADLALRFEDTARRLLAFSFLHRPGRAPNTREAVVHRNYLLIYSVSRTTIDVLAVVHARRRYP